MVADFEAFGSIEVIFSVLMRLALPDSGLAAVIVAMLLRFLADASGLFDSAVAVDMVF